MSVYTVEGRKLYDEALCLIPGLLSAKQTHSLEDGRLLLDSFHSEARSRGFSATMVWNVLFNASMHWLSQSSKIIAERDEVEVAVVIQMIGACAASWAARE